TVIFKNEVKNIMLSNVTHSIFLYYIGYYLILIAPIIYLNLISKFDNECNIEEAFSKVEFRNKDGSYPYLVKKVRIKRGEGETEKYIFSSSLNLDIWKNRKKDIETALNCTILKIEQGKKKTLVNIEAIPGNVKVDEFIPWKDEYIIDGDGLLVVGKNQLGYIRIDLNKTPHILSAGETGSGKSVILRCLLWQLIKKSCRVYMIDFKGGVEFGLDYEKYGEVITDKERALEVLKTLTKENKIRLKLFRESRVKNLYEYNKKENSNLCRIGVFIDELAELMDKTGVDKEEKDLLDQIQKEISTLARLSRATGINLFFGIQRPDAKVITGQIKNNVPVRICGRFADATASEIVLNNRMATSLPEIKGRFLYKSGAETIEFQAFYFDDEKHLKDIDIVQGEMLIERKKQKIKDPEIIEEKNIKESIKENEKEIVNENKEEIDGNFDLNLNY
ncbi:FtsK/SpoIIIE domain-containing protein, partial [Clostridium saccharoperbutylacetonicum]|uniref:FtsK/SpoIIIE domain-containing protein n=1 Tax=Clostridium saccharoperbutylacetonicum TaxID=36745 RepID=UPI0039EB43A5